MYSSYLLIIFIFYSSSFLLILIFPLLFLIFSFFSFLFYSSFLCFYHFSFIPLFTSLFFSCFSFISIFLISIFYNKHISFLLFPRYLQKSIGVKCKCYVSSYANENPHLLPMQMQSLCPNMPSINSEPLP